MNLRKRMIPFAITAIVAATSITALAADVSLRESGNGKVTAEWSKDVGQSPYKLVLYKVDGGTNKKTAAKTVSGNVLDVSIAIAKNGEGDYQFSLEPSSGTPQQSGTFHVDGSTLNRVTAYTGYSGKTSSSQPAQSETKAEVKPETKAETKTETPAAAETKTEPKAETKTEAKQPAKTEKKTESTKSTSSSQTKSQTKNTGNAAPQQTAAVNTAASDGRFIYATGRTDANSYDGWRKIDTGWIYMFESGEQAKNVWLEDKGYWYAFGSDGHLMTGWNKIKGNDGIVRDFYLETTENAERPLGALYVSTTTPDGYTVGADGSWVNDGSGSGNNSSENTSGGPNSEIAVPDNQIREGDRVAALSNITYDGKRFRNNQASYNVIQVRGNRVVIGDSSGVIAAVHISNLSKVG